MTMGTNYYATDTWCDHCKQFDRSKALHIGKSSAGWCFAVHAIPDKGLNDWPDWKEFLGKHRWAIVNECDELVPFEVLRATVEDRSFNLPHEEESRVPFGYDSWEQFHLQNHSEPGPENLLRHKVDGTHCIKHGEGTWDVIRGEFS